MGAVKFEGVDVLDFLGKVVELHTQHYKDDFDIDKELIQNLAACRKGENEQLLSCRALQHSCRKKIYLPFLRIFPDRKDIGRIEQ